MRFNIVGFIGFGLIGGSIAQAIRTYHPATHIIAYSRTIASLEDAQRAGVVNEIRTGVDEGFSSCDVIFLCAPVAANIRYLEQLKPLISKNCIITDVGSTKTEIHEQIALLDMEKNFIGGHPMAGSEKTGFSNSRSLLLENAYYILTPTEKTKTEAIDAMETYIASLKALPLVLSHKYHDYVTATISHLPHLIASSLVNLVHDLDGEEHIMKQVAAGGFKDITRIASSSPEMWESICMSNTENISRVLSDYISYLQGVQESLLEKRGHDIYKMFEDSRDFRNSFTDRAAGPIKKQYALYCDMVDEAGGIARLAMVLANHSISIKNIGIVHNREFQEGVLHVEFYEEKVCKRAAEILAHYGYTVYERS